jgi:hypothetical protein
MNREAIAKEEAHKIADIAGFMILQLRRKDDSVYQELLFRKEVLEKLVEILESRI